MSLLSRRLFGPLLVLGAAGCGLSDYEAKMRATQARLERFEQENKYLGNPLTMPTRKEKDESVPLANVFLRPPRGIQTSPSEEPRSGLLYGYRPAKEGAAGAFTVVELGFSSGQKDFPADVLGLFPAGGVSTRQRQVQPPGRKALTFDTAEFEDDQHNYSVNVWRGGDPQVAVVYWVARGQWESARKVIELSLATFAADAEAGRLRSAFATRSPWNLTPGPGR
jgi:hypothetical protein